MFWPKGVSYCALVRQVEMDFKDNQSPLVYFINNNKIFIRNNQVSNLLHSIHMPHCVLWLSVSASQKIQKYWNNLKQVYFVFLVKCLGKVFSSLSYYFSIIYKYSQGQSKTSDLKQLSRWQSPIMKEWIQFLLHFNFMRRTCTDLHLVFLLSLTAATSVSLAHQL